MSYHQYGRPAVTDNRNPSEKEPLVAEGIQVRRTFFKGENGADDIYLTECFGTVTPTTANCLVKCPATFTKTDASTSVFYVATGTIGSNCTGWSAQS